MQITTIHFVFHLNAHHPQNSYTTWEFPTKHSENHNQIESLAIITVFFLFDIFYPLAHHNDVNKELNLGKCFTREHKARIFQRFKRFHWSPYLLHQLKHSN